MGKRYTAFVINGNNTRSVKDLRKYVKGRKLSDEKFLEIALANTSIEQAEDEGCHWYLRFNVNCEQLNDISEEDELYDD